jgi:hypothetical protein
VGNRKACAADSQFIRGIAKETPRLGESSLLPSDLNALLSAADQALYRAKTLGRNRVETSPHWTDASTTERASQSDSYAARARFGLEGRSGYQPYAVRLSGLQTVKRASSYSKRTLILAEP